MLSVEQRVQSQTTAIHEFISSHEKMLDYLQRQIHELQETTTPGNQITYVYKIIDEINTQMKFSVHGKENHIQFLKLCERSMESINDNLGDVAKINWLVSLTS